MADTITIPIDRETSEKLASLSKQRDCSEAQLAQWALREYLDLQAWQMKAIEEGIDAADQGHLIEHDDLRRMWESKLGTQMG
jgi:predicted transcriptional regulator